MGRTNIGGKFYIAVQPGTINPFPVNDGADESYFSTLYWLQVPHMGNAGDTGVEQNIISYPMWDSRISLQQKGAAQGKQTEFRFLDDPSDGMTAMKKASKTSGNYAFKFEWADGKTEYNYGVVSETIYPKGSNEDFSEAVFTIASNQAPILTSTWSTTQFLKGVQSTNFLFNFTKPSTLFADAAGTLLASVNGKVGYVGDDVGGNVSGTNTQLVDRPTLRKDANGTTYLELPGESEYLALSNFSGSNTEHTFIAVIKSNADHNSADADWLLASELGPLVFANRGDSHDVGTFTDRPTGVYSGAQGWGSHSFDAKEKMVITFICKGTVCEVRKNGVCVGELPYDPTPIGGNTNIFSGYPLQAYFTGDCYSMCYVNEPLTHSQALAIEKELGMDAGLGEFFTTPYKSLVGLGDSITHGYGDRSSTDRTAGRNVAMGYTVRLTALLGSRSSTPWSVADEGYTGITTPDLLTKLPRIIERHTQADTYLLMVGHNDAGDATPSGLGSSPPTEGTYKYYLDRMSRALLNARKTIYLGYIPYYKYQNSSDQYIEDLIVEYNQVIDELVAAYAIATPITDFHTYFLNNQTEFSDNIHPNSTGYDSMANLWAVTLGYPA